MRVTDTALDGVKVLEYDVHTDCRGYSFPILDRVQLRQAGLDFDFSQEVVYHSEKAGTLYGIHFQNAPKAQTKLLYCIQGRGLDYAVDLRRESPTYLQWVCVELSAENRRQILIPKGFGHAFLALEDSTRNVIALTSPLTRATPGRFSERPAHRHGIPEPTAQPRAARHRRQGAGRDGRAVLRNQIQ